MDRPSSPADLHDLLVEAAETERRLPRAIGRKQITWWPTIARDRDWLAYADDESQTRLEPATASQVTRYDWLLDAIMVLPNAYDRKVLWSTAYASAFRSRTPWLKISRRYNCDRRTIKRHYELALLSLFVSL